MVFTLRPGATRLAAKAIGRRTLEQQAVETIVIAPADHAETGVAYSLPGEFDRVQAIHGVEVLDRSAGREEQWKRWMGPGPVEHMATRAFRVENALMTAGSIYVGRAFHDYSSDRELMARGRTETIHAAQFCGGQGGSTWFGHWLCEDLGTEILAMERELLPLALRSVSYPHEEGYRALFDLHAHKPALAWIRSLWLVDDRGYNQDHVRRFLAQRARLRANVTPNGRAPYVYLSRGQTGTKRNVVNETALMEALVARGFSVIEPEKLTPQEIAGALVGARLIVTVEGSALDHGLVALPEGAAVLALMPPKRFNIYNKLRCEFAGLRFAYLVADPHPDGFVVEPERVFRTMDLIPDL